MTELRDPVPSASQPPRGCPAVDDSQFLVCTGQRCVQAPVPSNVPWEIRWLNNYDSVVFETSGVRRLEDSKDEVVLLHHMAFRCVAPAAPKERQEMAASQYRTRLWVIMCSVLIVATAILVIAV